MLKLIVLVCSASLSPDECTYDSALMRLPAGLVSMPTQCAANALSVLPEIPLDPKQRFEKVVCRR